MTGKNFQMKKGLQKAFTLIELMVVMVIVSLLLTIAAPRYFHSIDRSKETVLKANLASTRDALDKYFADKGKYPEQLEDLVTAKYLGTLPFDPIAQSNSSWTIEAPQGGQAGSVYNIHSSAAGEGSNKVPYAQW